MNTKTRMPRKLRKLEIGPGKKKLRGYESVGMEYADTIADVSKRLPYPDETYDEVLASHVIEHIEWHLTQSVLCEWTRILKKGGILKVWTPDINKVLDILVRAEMGSPITPEELDSHVKMLKRHNPHKSPYIWANYRVFAAENPKAAVQYNRPHRSMFTFGHLHDQMLKAGLHNIRRIEGKPPYDHGHANMGVQGIK